MVIDENARAGILNSTCVPKQTEETGHLRTVIRNAAWEECAEAGNSIFSPNTSRNKNKFKAWECQNLDERSRSGCLPSDRPGENKNI